MKVSQVLTSTILPLLLTGVAQAATTVFTPTNGSNWEVAENWSAGVPGTTASNLDAVLNTTGSTATFNGTASNPALTSVVIDAPTTSASVLHLTGNLTTQSLIIGDTKFGAYTQKGGVVDVTGATTASHLVIGAGAGGNGSYKLEAGSLTAKFIHVGGGTTNPAGAATGTFLQTGGTVNVTGGTNEGELIVGDTSGTSGKYEITGGSLTTKQLYVGVQGANPTVGDRSFVQSGGQVTVSDNLTLGGYAGGISTTAGSYTLSGPTATSVLNTSKVWVGVSGSGTFTQDGGTHNITLGNAEGDHSLLIASAQAGSQGVYNMKNGVLNADGIYVGYSKSAATGGSGTLNHTGGTINVGQRLVVYNGGTPSSLGKYVMSGTAVLNTTSTSDAPGLYIAGSFDQQGGTINANSSSAVEGFRNDGAFTMSGGTLQGTGSKINYASFSGFGTIDGGKLTNAGTMTFSGGNSTISAPVENVGNFKTNGAAVTINGSFSNASGGYLTAITAGDLFRIGGQLSIQNPNSTLWSTETAVLEFFKGTGNTTGDHSLLYAGVDFGGASNANGFLGYQDNLSWGEVIIGAGNRLLSSGGGALYTEKLTFGTTDLAQIAAQVATFTGDLKIFYDPADNPQLQNQTFNFGTGTGSVAPVPEPSALLLAGIGAIALSFRRRRQ
ncbi:beta strand repeat-containing protein [Verrucomicrobiota bacterium sgz303538]